jgi:hypothetical protein
MKVEYTISSYNRYMRYGCFIRYQNLYLADRMDLFRISNLV